MEPDVSAPKATEPSAEQTLHETKQVSAFTEKETTGGRVKERKEREEERKGKENGDRQREERRDSRGRDGDRDRARKDKGRDSKSEKEREREKERNREKERERERDRERDSHREKEREKRRGDSKDERERKRSKTDVEKRWKSDDRRKERRDSEKRDRRDGDDKKREKEREKERGDKEVERREKPDVVVNGTEDRDRDIPIDVKMKTEEKESVKEEHVTKEMIDYLLSLPPETLTPYQVDLLLQHMESGGKRESFDEKKEGGETETVETETKETKQEAGEGEGLVNREVEGLVNQEVGEGEDGKETKEKEGGIDAKKETDERKDNDRGKSSGKDREREKERETERERRERRDRDIHRGGDKRRERSEERGRDHRRAERERDIDYERARLGSNYRDVRDRDLLPIGSSSLLSDRLVSDSQMLSRDLVLGASRRLSPLTERLIERERAALLLNDPLRGDPLLAGRGGSREDDWLRERLLLEEELLRRSTFGSGLGADPLRYGSLGSDILRVLARERDSLASDPLARDPLWRDRDPLGRDLPSSSGRYVDMDTRRGLSFGLRSPRMYDDRGRERADAIFGYDDVTERSRADYDAILRRRRLEVEEELMRRAREDSLARDPRDYIDARDRGRDPRDLRDARDVVRDLRDVRDPRDVRDARDLVRDTRDVRDPRDLRDARDPRDLRDARDLVRDPRDVRDVRDARDYDPLGDTWEEQIMQRRAEMAREGRSMGGDNAKLKKIGDWLGVDPVADPEKYEIAISKRTIYVGNLPVTYNPDKDRDAICRTFEQFGDVMDVRDRHGSRFLFLTFREPSQASRALDLCKQGLQFNGSLLLIRTAHTGSQSKARRK